MLGDSRTKRNLNSLVYLLKLTTRIATIEVRRPYFAQISDTVCAARELHNIIDAVIVREFIRSSLVSRDIAHWIHMTALNFTFAYRPDRLSRPSIPPYSNAYYHKRTSFVTSPVSETKFRSHFYDGDVAIAIRFFGKLSGTQSL